MATSDWLQRMNSRWKSVSSMRKRATCWVRVSSIEPVTHARRSHASAVGCPTTQPIVWRT